MYQLLLDILTWLSDDIYDFFVSLFSFVVSKLIVISLNIAIGSIEFFTDVTKTMFETFGINQYIIEFTNRVDSDIMDFMAYMNIIKSLIVVTTAKITRYIFDVVGL